MLVCWYVIAYPAKADQAGVFSAGIQKFKYKVMVLVFVKQYLASVSKSQSQLLFSNYN